MKQQRYILSEKVDVHRALLVTLFVLVPTALVIGALCSAYRALDDSLQDTVYPIALLGVLGGIGIAAWEPFPRLLRWARIRSQSWALRICYLVALCIPAGSLLCKICLGSESGFSSHEFSQWFFQEGMWVCGFGFESYFFTTHRLAWVFQPFCETCLQYHELSSVSFTISDVNALEDIAKKDDRAKRVPA